VRRPATRRVAELVGYLSFVRMEPVGDGAVAGVHPERVVPGAEATVTVLDPPCFGRDGLLLPRSAEVRT
jgi:hypothetical protein